MTTTCDTCHADFRAYHSQTVRCAECRAEQRSTERGDAR